LTTSQTFTATASGAIWTDITSHAGIVNVNVDPTLTHVTITVSTGDYESQLADAVRNTTKDEGRNLDCLTIRVPEIEGNVMTTSNSTSRSSGGNTVVVSQNFGAVSGSVVTGITGSNDMIGGDTVVSQNFGVVSGSVVTGIGGNGDDIVEGGTVVSGVGMDTITIDVKLPSDQCSLRLRTSSADLTVRGDLQVLDVHSVSGHVEAKAVHTLHGNVTSGDIEVEQVDALVDVTSVSGDIEIGAYSGSAFRVSTVKGDVYVRATPAASGSIDITSVSGDITTRSTSHLHERVHTVSGRHRSL
jgi:hypothetical protein